MQRVILCFLCAFQLVFLSNVRAEVELDFARDVLPILSERCYVCHGPDAKEDELRLDSFEGATVDLGGYYGIDQESPEDSEIIFRIFDKEDPMPPRKAESQLTDAERDILARWVKSGGEYAKHWAFELPKKPEGKTSTIDAFVSNALQDKGFDLAQVADKPTLARRAALTLTGLPPEGEQLTNYLADVASERTSISRARCAKRADFSSWLGCAWQSTGRT